MPEKSGRKDDVVGAAETLEHEIAQARRDGDPPHQGTGEYRARNGHTGNDREVGPPVMHKAASEECGVPHGRHPTRSSRRSTSSKRIGKREASSALCVTTIRMAFC